MNAVMQKHLGEKQSLSASTVRRALRNPATTYDKDKLKIENCENVTKEK
jgi:hypothetical protein